MFRISSENELLSSFRAIDLDEVQIPADFHFPLAIKDYLSWIEPSGHRVYLVLEDTIDGGVKGIVFQRTHGGPDAPASMCQWCHSVRTGGGVALLTATAGPKRRIGLHLCSDLACKEHLLPGVQDFQESLSVSERKQRLFQRMREFAKRHLF